MPSVRVIRERKWTSPVLRLDDSDKARIAKLVLGDILNNIKTQRQADGSPLKRNTAGTARRKAEKRTLVGGVAMSLVDEEHRFVKRGNWIAGWVGEKTLAIEPGSLGGSPSLRELAQHVQEMGYTGWFAVSADGLRAVQQLLKDFIKKALRRG